MSEFDKSSENEQITPSQELSKLLLGIGEEFGFDTETCNEIAEQPFEEAFETAYGYITQAGLNADEVLSDFLEQPEGTD